MNLITKPRIASVDLDNFQTRILERDADLLTNAIAQVRALQASFMALSERAVTDQARDALTEAADDLNELVANNITAPFEAIELNVGKRG